VDITDERTATLTEDFETLRGGMALRTRGANGGRLSQFLNPILVITHQTPPPDGEHAIASA